jgi:hypothetical protein
MSALRTTPAIEPSPPLRRLADAAPDLWCTYAAVRTASWLGATAALPGRAETAAYLRSRGNGDGGYAWSAGMTSDAWATYYSTQSLRDLGEPVPHQERLARWVESTWTAQSYAMTPGQDADVWATYYAVRTLLDVTHRAVRHPAEVVDWIGRLQATDGGLAWSPEHAVSQRSDVRACHYGVLAWHKLNSRTPAAPPWDVPRLLRWLWGRQHPSGGFILHAGADVPCLWATYRAVAALRALGARPQRVHDCRRWIAAQRGATGAFVRWPGYDVEDVWASFCAVGALRALGARVEPYRPAVMSALIRFACRGGGFTYREPVAAVSILHAAASLLRDGPQPDVLDWVRGCQLPNEGGLMYMPGRGAEVRCTLWALLAGAGQGRPDTVARIGSWLPELQNPDGGFGYWAGRASDMVSTVAAVEIDALLARLPGCQQPMLDHQRVRAFVLSCRRDGGYSAVPRARPTLRSSLQALRALGRLEAEPRTGEALDLLRRHQVRGGGYANLGNRLPDLLTTYEAALCSRRLDLPVDFDGVRRLLRRLRNGDSFAWTPAAPAAADALAECVAHLLERAADFPDAALPPIVLS